VALPDATAVLDSHDAGRRAVRGAGLRVAGYVVSILLSVIAAALLTRHLGAVGYGRYTVVLSITAVITGVAEAGMTTIGLREYSIRPPETRGAFLASLNGLRMALALAGLLVSVGFGALAGYPGVMVAGLAVTGIVMLLTTLQSTWSVPLGAGLRAGWLTGLEIGRLAGQTALVALFVAVNSGLLWFFAAPLPVGIVLLAVMLPLVRGTFPLMPRVAIKDWMPIVRLIGPYAAAVALGSVYAYIATVVMSLTASEADVGYFAAAFRVFIVLGGVAIPAVTIAFPVLARAARDDHVRLAYATARLLDSAIIFGSWLALMTFLCAPLAIDVVAGPKFDPSVDVLRIQAIAVLGSFIAATGIQTIISVDRIKPLIWVALFALLLSAGLTAALVPALGAQAGAVANVAGELVAGGSALVLLRHIDRRFVPSLRVVLGVAVATALAAALALVPDIPQVVLGAAATAVFFVVLLLLRAIPRELIDAVPTPRWMSL
jgi:O-antigen/teichoic acid export membrane protein